MGIFTEVSHNSSYAAISPHSPANQQNGRTVLVAGSTEGIGFSIARSFISAKAATVIITGRRQAMVNDAVNQLKSLDGAQNTDIIGLTCDISSSVDVSTLWQGLADHKVKVDVLVLNAALAAGGSLQGSITDIWQSFEVNILANLRMTQAFLAQRDSQKHGVVLNVSSAAAHLNPSPSRGAYSASKAGFASLLQHLAEEKSADEVQMISFHPGAILTPEARRHGLKEDTLPFDHEDLPGHFAVWASTTAASFLHGRFVWAKWDVEELMRRKQEITEEPGMLKIGLQGVGYLGMTNMFE